MEILDTLVSREIAAIGSTTNPTNVHNWSLVFKANGQVIKPVYIKDVKVDRLYHRNYADEVRVTVGLTYGDLQYNLLPYKDTLEVTLTRIPMTSGVVPENSESGSRVVGVFKAQFQNANSSAISGDNPLALAKSMAGNAEIVDISVQLFSSVIDRFRKKTLGTNFRKTAPIDAIAYVLLKYSRGASDDEANAVKGINIDSTFVKEPRDHIVIKDVTPVADIGHVIDKQVGGTHPAQMRYYLQGNYWYMFPIFDHQRFLTVSKSLTIIKIPKHRLPGIEKTYRRSGDQVIILSTSGTTHQDSSQTAQLNDGNGVRFADARKVMNGFSSSGDNKLTVDASSNVNEVLYEPRKDEVDMVTRANSNLLTDKYNHEYALLARKSGAFVQITWDRANIDLLYPGMPIRYIFQDGEVTKELYGTLNAVETLDYNTNNTITNPRFVTMALLTCFVSHISPLRKETTDVQTSTTKST